MNKDVYRLSITLELPLLTRVVEVLERHMTNPAVNVQDRKTMHKLSQDLRELLDQEIARRSIPSPLECEQLELDFAKKDARKK